MSGNEERQAKRQKCYERCMRIHGWKPVCVFSPRYPKPTSHMPEARWVSNTGFNTLKLIGSCKPAQIKPGRSIYKSRCRDQSCISCLHATLSTQCVSSPGIHPCSALSPTLPCSFLLKVMPNFCTMKCQQLYAKYQVGSTGCTCPAQRFPALLLK